MDLNERQSKLFEFVRDMHGDQKRKYSEEPYYTHLLSVAEIVSRYETGNEVEVALCHDLIEDTSCSLVELSAKLIEVGYSAEDSSVISAAVDDLTDRFTKSAYPSLNRAQRKAREADRVAKAGVVAQTVKYADVLDNISSLWKLDAKFALVYLREVLAFVPGLRKGNAALYAECISTLEKIRIQLG